MLRHCLALLLAVILGGCALDQLGGSTTTTATTAAAEQDAPTTAVVTTQDTGESSSPCLAGDRPFASGGVISAFGGANGDAAQISGIRWASHQGCERIVVDLLTADGAPAGALDPVGVDYDPDRGVIRVNLPDAITRSAVSDSLVDGDLVERVYVVETEQRGIAIDVHIVPGTALALRAFEVDSPSRIVIDVKEQEEAPQVLGAAIGPSVVLLSPLPTSTDSSLTVAGYARSVSGVLEIRVFTDPAADPLIEEDIELGSSDLWMEFHTELIGLPARPLVLEVTTREAPVATQVVLGARTPPGPGEA